jgi:hypothetical protein
LVEVEGGERPRKVDVDGLARALVAPILVNEPVW